MGENEQITSIRILFLFLLELDSFVWVLIYIGEEAEVNSYLGSNTFNAGKQINGSVVVTNVRSYQVADEDPSVFKFQLPNPYYAFELVN